MRNTDDKIQQLINRWFSDPEIRGQFSYSFTREASYGSFCDFPDNIDPVLKSALQAYGYGELFSHQRECFDLIVRGSNVLLNTGTASGKTLAFYLPILNHMLTSHEISSALFLYPTKALANDQLSFFQSINQKIREGHQHKKWINDRLKSSVYDGDTPRHIRSSIKKEANILLTNPDMLHYAILPYHTSWDRFLSNLKFIVIDEIHVYRGVFGSHIANILRRLSRVLKLYGSMPQIICNTATIGNPKEFAEKLTEREFSLIIENGSPQGKKDIFLINPPIVNQELGIRRSAHQTTINFTSDLLRYGLQTLIFQITRRSVEKSLRHFQERDLHFRGMVQSYRSGYLPAERRELENALKNGELKALFSTNAMELGIDIGGLNSVLISGYPGSIASTLQQFGRSGRKFERSIAALIADSNPIDQYLISHPDFLFEKNPENALIDPDNPLILMYHLKCAAHELLFDEGDTFGTVNWETIHPFLELFTNEGYLHRVQNRYFWISDTYPAADFSIRNTGGNLVTLVQQTEENHNETVIGQVDYSSSLWMVHPGAVYLHRGENFLVEKLDLSDSKAFLVRKLTDYYTEPERETNISVINVLKSEEFGANRIYFGDIKVTTQITGYKEILWDTRETLSRKPLDLPQQTLETEAFWLVIDQSTVDYLKQLDKWYSDRQDYGPDWGKIREVIRARDHFQCQHCGLPENNGAHHVHHKIPLRAFKSRLQANRPDNLVTLCPACHKKAEMQVKIQSGLSGIAYLLRYFAPLFLMCDFEDIGVFVDAQSSFSEGLPVCMMYDSIPLGIGLSKHFYDIFGTFLEEATRLVSTCNCKDGCPACVGPVAENGRGAKEDTIALISSMMEKYGS